MPPITSNSPPAIAWRTAPGGSYARSQRNVGQAPDDGGGVVELDQRGVVLAGDEQADEGAARRAGGVEPGLTA